MTDGTDVLETEKPEAPFRLGKTMMAVARAGKRGPIGQLSDIMPVRRGPGRLTAREYYDYALFDRARFPSSELTRFAGVDRQREDGNTINDRTWYVLGQDKLASGAMLAGMDLPVPEIRAVVHRDYRAPGLTMLRTAEDLAGFLREGMAYPFFAKPIGGSFSLGIAAVEFYESANDTLVLADGRTVAVESFARELFTHYGAARRHRIEGYLLQDLLRQHRALDGVCGTGALSTIRVVLLIDDGVPEIFRAAWKIRAAGNLADNFWRSGNLLAPVDPATGTVGRALRGIGLGQDELDDHPDTGHVIKGFVLPDWDALTDLAKRAVHAFPGMQMQAWDIALTDRGPYLIEVNGVGDFTLPQFAEGRGLLDETYLAFLGRCRKRAASA